MFSIAFSSLFGQTRYTVALLTPTALAIMLADSPLACIRSARAAFDLSSAFRRWHDLLDANESTWAFAVVGRVGCDGKPLIKALVMLSGDGACRDHCGHSADAGYLTDFDEREEALGHARHGLKRNRVPPNPSERGSEL